jgi:cytochrome c biogenesis protein CcmG, thiol:disulfide interchange protein DsbE
MSGNPANPSKRTKSIKPFALAMMGLGLLLLGGLAMILTSRFRLAQTEKAGSGYPSAVPSVVDFPAPELALADTTGNPSSLADYQGKVVLVNNWAFWCPPCRAELPELQAYYEAHRSEDFTIIGIEAGGDQEDVVYHVELYGLDYPVWLDPGSRALQVFRNGGLPNSYVIDRDGTVRLAWNGPINREMLEQYVTPIIEEKK